MNSNALYISQQLFIHLLHVFVMSKVVIYHRHLSTTNASTNVRHTIVVTYLLMLIVWVAFTILSCVHHYLSPMLLILCDKRTTTRSSNHLITIERQHTILTKGSKHLSFVARTKALSSILYDRNTILIGYLHDAVSLIRHTIQSHGNYCFRILASFLLAVNNCFLQQFRVDVPCVRLRVHQHRCSPKIRHRMC